MIVVSTLLAYVAAVCFYHSEGGRSAVKLSSRVRCVLRWLAWAILIGPFFPAAEWFGWERGVFIQLFCSSLALLASLLIASHWPLRHLQSGIVATILVIAVGASL